LFKPIQLGSGALRLSGLRWLPAPGCLDGIGGNLVGGVGQLGEAVGQAAAVQDEAVGVEDFGLAEFG